MGREWELSFRLGMRPWIAVAYSAPVAAALPSAIAAQKFDFDIKNRDRKNATQLLPCLVRFDSQDP
jgi:hypothetical protein